MSDFADAQPPTFPPYRESAGGEVGRAGLEAAQAASPAGLPVSFLSSAVDGVAAGRFPNGWRGGVSWTPIGCAPGGVWYDECDPDRVNPDDKTDIACDQVTACVAPIDVFFPQPIGRCSQGDAEELARQNLAAITGPRMAQELHNQLSQHAWDVSGGEHHCPEQAMGLLFENRALNGSPGSTVHVPYRALFSLKSCFDNRGGRPTMFGNPVIADPGYSAQVGPGGAVAPPGTTWIYISGPVDYALGEIEILNSGDSAYSFASARQNKGAVVAERRALVRVDPCNIFAICVALPGCDACVEGEIEETP